MILSDINDKLCKLSSFIPDIFTSMGNNPFLVKPANTFFASKIPKRKVINAFVM